MPSFSTSPAEQTPLCARSPFRSNCRPGRGKFARGYSGPQRKSPGRRGRHRPGRTSPPGADDKGGTRRPGHKARWRMVNDLGDAAPFGAAVTPTALPFLAALSPVCPGPPAATPAVSFLVFFKRVVRSGHWAQPFPPHRGRPSRRSRLIDGPDRLRAPASGSPASPAVCLGSGAAGCCPVTPGAASAALPSPGSGGGAAAGPGRAGPRAPGPRAEGAGRGAGGDSGGREAGGRGPRPAPRPRRASRDRLGGGAAPGFEDISVCQAFPG